MSRHGRAGQPSPFARNRTPHKLFSALVGLQEADASGMCGTKLDYRLNEALQDRVGRGSKGVHEPPERGIFGSVVNSASGSRSKFDTAVDDFKGEKLMAAIWPRICNLRCDPRFRHALLYAEPPVRKDQAGALLREPHSIVRKSCAPDVRRRARKISVRP
jgi:hypothetical protein